MQKNVLALGCFICLALWTAAVFYWNMQYDGGCWCGPFANWVPADGLVHTADAPKFDHVLQFVCSNAQCRPAADPTANALPGTHFAIFALRAALLAAAPVVLLAAAGVQRARKKLVSSAGNAAANTTAKPWTPTPSPFPPLSPMI